MSELRVTFLGTGSSTPSAYRGFPATLIQREGVRMLFDCGEGTQRQMARYGAFNDVDAIFLTHYHTDHTYGLPPLLASYSARERRAPLCVFGPALGLDRFRQFVRSSIKDSRLTFPVEYHAVVTGTPIFPIEHDAPFDVVAAEADHGVPALSYAVVEPTRPGRMSEELLLEYGIFGRKRASLKAGVAVHNPAGDLVMPSMVMGPSRPGRKVVISGDTMPTSKLVNLANDADLLIHEASFATGDAGIARRKKHSTVADALVTAANADVRNLALHHIGPKLSPAILGRDLGDSEAYVPDDGSTVEVELRDE